MAVDKHIVYVVTLCVIFLFVCLTGGLNFRCGTLFSKSCQRWKTYTDITGLVATSLVLFVIALIFAILLMVKDYKWSLYALLATTGLGAILMLAAVCITFQNGINLARLFAVMTMALSIELTVFMLIDLFV